MHKREPDEMRRETGQMCQNNVTGDRSKVVSVSRVYLQDRWSQATHQTVRYVCPAAYFFSTTTSLGIPSKNKMDRNLSFLLHKRSDRVGR